MPQEKKPMLSFQQALAQLLEAVSCHQQVQHVPLSQALGRVLAEDMQSPLQIPAYTNAAMDGYAFCYADVASSKTFQLIGQSLAGHPYQGELTPGCCIRIMTGAKLPPGLDTVVMQEQVKLTEEGKVQLCTEPQMGEHVRLAGSEIAKEATVLRRGERLGPLQLGLAATLGFAELPVYQRLKVGVMSTGDELVAPGLVLGDGQLYDSNRFVIGAMLQRLDVALVDYGWIADDPVLLKAAFDQAASEVDALVTSGGVSVGDADYTRQVLLELGQVNFWQVAMKPGKPFAFGKLGHCWFFGLPGNPVSAVMTLDQLAQPALRKLAGETCKTPLQLPALVSRKFRKKPGRLDFQRGVLSMTDGQLQVAPVAIDSSGMLSSLLAADCLVPLALESADIEAGERVQVQLLSDWLR